MISVLVVDDSVVVRRLVTDALAGDPHIEVVGTAPNGRVALDKIAELKPDLVTLDIEMPVMDGITTLRELRKSHRMPVIMFSTLTASGAAATFDALSAGASDYVTKPANVGSVAESIRSVREQLIPRIHALAGPPDGRGGAPGGVPGAGQPGGGRLPGGGRQPGQPGRPVTGPSTHPTRPGTAGRPGDPVRPGEPAGRPGRSGPPGTAAPGPPGPAAPGHPGTPGAPPGTSGGTPAGPGRAAEYPPGRPAEHPPGRAPEHLPGRADGPPGRAGHDSGRPGDPRPGDPRTGDPGRGSTPGAGGRTGVPAYPARPGAGTAGGSPGRLFPNRPPQSMAVTAGPTTAGPSPAGPSPAGPVGRPGGRVEVIAIGCSTGGPDALTRVIKMLPAGLPVPVLVVQHMPPVFTKMFAERLDRTTALTVVEAAADVPVEPGTVYIAPGDFHLEVKRAGTTVSTVLQSGPPENFCRPAVDVLFRSVNRVYGRGTLAVVLTGMGADGKLGAADLARAGAEIVAQDEESSVVWGMPGAVVNAGLATAVLPLDDICTHLVTRVNGGRAARSMEVTR